LFARRQEPACFLMTACCDLPLSAETSLQATFGTRTGQGGVRHEQTIIYDRLVKMLSKFHRT
jgi:hypothetical protein